MTGGAEVGAAVALQQLSDVEAEVVLARVDEGVEAPCRLLVLLDEELQLGAVVVLSVPEHGVAAHAEPDSHAALQRQRRSCVGQQVSRLKDFDGRTCRR